ncbi:MAG: glycosyltransferase family 4 protein [Magnetospirillum sp.]|nr:glycosyltransferase family 4 protein [Magnetospirillum sp.]
MTTTRLLYLVSHPIQYQAPLLRLIAAEPGIQLRVLFERDTEAGYYDPGFQCDVRWDVPLRQGYDSALAAHTDLAAEIAAAQVVWLHGWQGGRMRRALVLARALGKPVLMRGENNDCSMPDGGGLKGWLKRRWLAWIFARVDGFLAIGSANADYYRARGVAADRIHPMPYAVDNAAFAAAAKDCDRAALRARLGLEPGRRVVLYAGKLMGRKHPDVLLQAWTQAAWPGQPPHLLYVGDGEMRARLQALAGAGVVFAGFRNQSELPGLYALADVFVLASEREPWGLAVNEAMACGTAIVVSDQVGCAVDLVDETCGAVVPAGDAAALAAALVHVVGRAESAGDAAARKVADWDYAADLAGLKQALATVRVP